MATVYVYEVDAGPAGLYWEGCGMPGDYPVVTWDDTAQLGRDIVELAGEGHEVIVRSQAWYVENQCGMCGVAPRAECWCPTCDVCGVREYDSERAWDGDNGVHVACLPVHRLGGVSA